MPANRLAPAPLASLAAPLVALLVGLALAWTAQVRAQESPLEPEDVPQALASRVGVVLLPGGQVTPEVADSVTELVIAALAGRGAREIVGKEEFQVALGRDDAGTLACIESNACLGRMGRELRVSELVAGTLRLDRDPAGEERYRFDLYRLDAASGHVRGRVTREIEGGLAAVLELLTSSIDELYVEHVEPGAIALSIRPPDALVELDSQPLEAQPREDGEDALLRRGFLPPGRHRLVARADGYEPLFRDVTIDPGTTLMLSLELSPRTRERTISLVTGLLYAGSGVVLATAAGLGVLSQAIADEGLDMRASWAFYEDRQREALSANILFGVAGALLVGALVGTILDFVLDDDDGASEALQAALRGEGWRW